MDHICLHPNVMVCIVYLSGVYMGDHTNNFPKHQSVLFRYGIVVDCIFMTIIHSLQGMITYKIWMTERAVQHLRNSKLMVRVHPSRRSSAPPPNEYYHKVCSSRDRREHGNIHVSSLYLDKYDYSWLTLILDVVEYARFAFSCYTLPNQMHSSSSCRW